MAVVTSTNGRARTSTPRTGEIGKSGLSAFYGHVSETYLSRLEWPDVYDIYDEMRRRDPTLRGLLNAVKLLARQATWTATPATDSDADREAAEFLQSNLEDMSHTVEDFIDDVLTFLPFGWSSFELVYKRRDDGRIGWRKFANRRQSSFSRWQFDDTGGMAGWYQTPAPSYEEIFLPIEKLLHFVGERDGQNPEGLALFESAYEPWHYVKNLQIISGIGWQRAFVGLPVFEFEEKPSSDDKAAIKSVGEGLRIDEKQYVSVPPGVGFRLESTGNSGADSLLNTIKFYRTLMLQMVLADFMMLGTSSNTGSWALGSDKSALFLMAVDGYLDKIAAIWNCFGVDRLFEFNEFPGMTKNPQVTHSVVRKIELGQLASFVSQIAAHIRLDDEDEIWIRDQAGMPGIDLSEREDEEPEEAPPPPTDSEPTEEQQESDEAAPEVAEASAFFRAPEWAGYG